MRIQGEMYRKYTVLCLHRVDDTICHCYRNKVLMYKCLCLLMGRPRPFYPPGSGKPSFLQLHLGCWGTEDLLAYFVHIRSGKAPGQ